MTWEKLSSGTSGTPTTLTSKWAGKSWYAVGDSITEVNSRTTTNYHKYIADAIGMTVTNYGKSGTGYFNSTTNTFWERVATMGTSADLITVFGGTNDWNNIGKTLVLGSFGDTDGAASFYGAVDKTFSNLVAKYPTATIAAFTPLPRSDAFNTANVTTGITLKQVADAIKEVAAKYSIPVLDLYRNSGFFPWNATNNAAYFNAGSGGDGLHPNTAGHKRIADQVLSFLNSL
jgi:lysophospholipase L1-like esterase